MGKGNKPAPGHAEEPGCCRWENTGLKLTGLNCLIQETEGNPSIKYGILITRTFILTIWRLTPAGLVTVSKRYGEKMRSLNFHSDIFHWRTVTSAHFGLTQGRISVPRAHIVTHDRQRLAGQQVSYEHQTWSFTRAISNSLRGVLLTDYFKAHQFSCCNHPSEKIKSDRRTRQGSGFSGKEQRTTWPRKLFLSHTIS